MSEWVTAFDPASIGNVAVGFDMLGLALEDVGDRVLARRASGADISIAEVRGLDGGLHPYLSTDAKSNTASRASRLLGKERRIVSSNSVIYCIQGDCSIRAQSPCMEILEPIAADEKG